jgi:broad specificity phosphatase PhoE
MHAFMADASDAKALQSDTHSRAPAPQKSDKPFLILARHGRPWSDRSVWIDAQAYKAWWDGYDAAGLAEGQTPPKELCEAALAAPVILTSTLRRSIDTAAAVCCGQKMLSDDIFVEARLPPPPLPGFVRLRPGAWGVIARIAWWFGYSGGQESRQAAEKRAIEATGRLIKAAEEHGGAMLVAHGWFNRMIRPLLLKAGWACVEDGGDSYWSFRRYERR